MAKISNKSSWIKADFNGLFGELLCLSHEETGINAVGETIQLKPGMALTAFDIDHEDDETRNDLIATGIVECSPDWLQCRGSKWALRINGDGVRHESDIEKDV